MENDNPNKLLGLLRSNLVAPIKEELKCSNERIANLEKSVKKFRQRLLFLKIILVVGLCLHLWCGFMATQSWMWIIYLLLIICL